MDAGKEDGETTSLVKKKGVYALPARGRGRPLCRESVLYWRTGAQKERTELRAMALEEKKKKGTGGKEETTRGRRKKEKKTPTAEKEGASLHIFKEKREKWASLTLNFDLSGKGEEKRGEPSRPQRRTSHVGARSANGDAFRKDEPGIFSSRQKEMAGLSQRKNVRSR